jgi:hypothetical protein
MTTGIDRAIEFSNEKLTEVRDAISSIVPDGQLVVTCGSYARREASSSSDMDYYSVESVVDNTHDPEWLPLLRATIEEKVGKLPAAQGAFATNITENELLSNYGGSQDSNSTITRRMLYLLEGEYLSNEQRFLDIRHKIIERYVDNTPRDHQVAFYLLNDIIRYWRTLAVDYADKTYGTSNPKPWAIRNLKLIFSRKLIYASGLFSVALTADRTKHEKVAILNKMFGMTPLDRIRYVSGEVASERLFQMYSLFLDRIGDSATREKLDKLTPEQGADDPDFREIKNEGHYFSRELMGVFSRTFHSSHPIHMAVVF